ncbi:MAG: hypothetical protein ABMB14_08290 [Myxococcota bacterium]
MNAPMLLLAGLFGCPYVFGPPDLSNVDADGDPTTPPSDGDADTDADSDADADSDSDADTDPLPGDPPVIATFTVSPRLTQVVVQFALADPDDTSLLGVTLNLNDGTTDRPYVIPDVTQWDPEGVSTIVVQIPEIPGTPSWLDCDTPVHQTWTLTATDLDGHVSEVAEVPLDVEALGTLPEVGDVWPLDQHAVAAAPPFTGCVTFEVDPLDPANDNQQLRRDFEGIGFTTTTPANYVAELGWPAANPCDVDLYVYWYPTRDIDLDGIADVIDSSLQAGAGAETTTWVSQTSEGFLVDFPFFQQLGGGSPPYTAQFLVSVR